MDDEKKANDEPEKMAKEAGTEPDERTGNVLNHWSKVVRSVTLALCLIAVVVQFDQCWQKLMLPPVTTHTRFHVNDSLWYPALTFCRDPPYRQEVLVKYGLGATPKYTSQWRNYPWGQVTMNEFFAEATYPADEVFLLYGLNGTADSKFHCDVAIESAYFFESGLCHTLVPKATTSHAGLDVGYSVLVGYTDSEDKPSGWNVYVHEPEEKWTEYVMQALGRQEALYVEAGEEVHIRISVQEFVQTNVGQTRHCINVVEGGEVRCTERCRWEQSAEDNCAGPWMHGVDLPECDNYNDTLRLIISYLRFDGCSEDCCGCRKSCRIVRYEVLPLTRKPLEDQMTQLYVFFNSRMVTLMEERPAYDWSSFLAEIGGSLGFLLGVSVLGLIKILESGVALLTSFLVRESQ